MSRKKLIAGGIILLAVVVAVASLNSGPSSQITSGGEKIGVISIEGTIMGGSNDIIGGVAGSDSIMSNIRDAADDPSVKAVVLKINSPGGSVGATQEIYREIKKLKETGKPVVASMGETAASGGYWLSTAADKIYANSGTLTGSIGVIMQTPNLEELYEKLGMEFDVIKSGPHKDIGSTSREMTQEERAILQGIVDEIFAEFINVVAEGRDLPREEVEKLATGRIFTGKQAKDVKLVDEIGNYYDAVRGAAAMAGIEGEPEIVMFGDTSVFASLFRSKGNLSEMIYRFLGLESLRPQYNKYNTGPLLLAVPGSFE